MAQDQLAPADHDGDVFNRDLEMIQQLLHAGVAVEIDVRVGLRVACQELLDTQRVGAMLRAEQHQAAEPLGDQLDAAEYERTHDQLAEVSACLYESRELTAIQLDHLARFAR